MEQDEYFQARQQGDLIRLQHDNEDRDYAIVSQTCDVVQPKRETILLAPTTQSLSETEVGGAADRSNPRYVLVGGQTIDLGKIQYFTKEVVNGAQVLGGLDPTDHDATRKFSLAVGRWFSRFPVPDELHPWLAPLQKLIRSKYAKESSPLHTVLQDVVEVRVEADQWFSSGRRITIHTIVKASALPLDFSTAEITPPINTENAKPQTPSEVAEQMTKTGAPYPESQWNKLAWTLADTCKLGKRDQENSALTAAVREVDAELWSEDDFPLSRMRQSEQLDIDFLSDPQPH